MTMIKPRVRGRVEQTPDVEVLFPEARRRGRARRRRRLIVAVVVAAAVGAGGITWHEVASRGAGSRETSTALPPASTAFPSTFVAYSVADKTLKGGISLFDSSTGRVVRTIVPYTARTPYNDPLTTVDRGFAVSEDGSRVFFTRFDTVAAGTVTRMARIELQIAEADVKSGRVRILADGSHPAVSPDGSMLAYRTENRQTSDGSSPDKPTVGLIDLATGAKSTVDLPGVKPGQFFQFSWLPGSRGLLVASTDVEQQSGAVANAGRTPVSTIPRFTSKAQVFDVATRRFAVLPAATTRALEETNSDDITILGPTRTAGVVQVVDHAGLPFSADPEVVGMLDTATGRLKLTHRIPAGFGLAQTAGIGGQSTGMHYLLQREADGRVYRWTPGSGQALEPVDVRLLDVGVEAQS